jgi:hypothetical protein
MNPILCYFLFKMVRPKKSDESGTLLRVDELQVSLIVWWAVSTTGCIPDGPFTFQHELNTCADNNDGTVIGDITNNIRTASPFLYRNRRTSTSIHNRDWRIDWIHRHLVYRGPDATLNNISVISWRSVLLVEETRVPGENHWPVTSHWQTWSHKVVLSTPRHERGSNSQL